MDRASSVLAEGPPPGVANTYSALAEYSGVPRSTLHARACGRGSVADKAQSQQYLTTSEEKALVDVLLNSFQIGQPVPMTQISDLAFQAASKRQSSSRPRKPPGKNWAGGLFKRHLALSAARAVYRDRKRHQRDRKKLGRNTAPKTDLDAAPEPAHEEGAALPPAGAEEAHTAEAQMLNADEPPLASRFVGFIHTALTIAYMSVQEQAA